MAALCKLPSFSEQETEIPKALTEYINNKTQNSKAGGRPHFLLQTAKQGRDPKQELLDILEYAWLKNRSIRSIGRKYKTSYLTIYRILQDLEPSKQAIIEYLETTPRRKVFFNKDSETSDYERVQDYINKARRFKLKHYKSQILIALKCWRFLKYRDPSRWSAENVVDYLATLSEGSQSRALDAIRQVAPQIADPHSLHYVSTGRYREKLRLRKKDLFGVEVEMILKALINQGMTYHALVFKLHITLGAREGSTDSQSGITGLSWDRFKREFTVVDLYECKVRGGIWWRDSPINLFFNDLSKEMKALWIKRGQPSEAKIIVNGYDELLTIYKEIREALAQYYPGKVEPSLLKEFATLKPHDADKIHVNLLWEAEIPLEVVAGKYLGRGEGIGLMGRGWLDINTLKKHYLSLTERSERIQKLRRQVRNYAIRFNENMIFHKTVLHESIDKPSEQKKPVLSPLA